MQAQDLIKRVAEYDKDLARDLQKFIGSRKLGLVYEESKPEYVRLWSKPVVEGDLVNILPPRGVAENLTDETDEHDVIWRVAQIADNTARLYKIESGELRDASLSDLVTVARFDQNIYCGLRETGRVERGGDKPYQVVINGENFHAVESLLFAYRGKVDCIYIDPPYNTGAKDWKYNNNYVGKNDRSPHSKWLTFMEDRLRVAQYLLKPKNSVLICTIDEHEYLRLGLLLEKLFPNDRIQMVNIVINKNGVSRSDEFKRAEEYAFFVMKGDAKPVELNTARYSPFIDSSAEKPTKVRWEWLLRGGSNSLRTDRPNLFYPIYINEASKTIESVGDPIPLETDWRTIHPPIGLRALWPLRLDGTEATWRMQPSSLKKKMDKGLVRIGAYDNENDRYSILYLADIQEKRIASGQIVVKGKREDGSLIVEYAANKKSIPTTVWGGPEFSAGEYGSRFLTSIFGDKRFTFPKSFYATELTLAPFVAKNPDAVIVDFFAGSGTTAHSVMLLNHLDGGRRTSISITNNEVSADEASTLSKNGFRQGDDEWERFGICKYVTEPRIRSVISGKRPDGTVLENDYKFIEDFPMSEGFEENAIFYDLTYLEPSVVSADLAFDEIAPLLWMRAGSSGPMIRHGRTFELTDTYGVLFDIAYSASFIRECREHSIGSVFVVTDIDAEWRAICRELPGVDVVQLYKHYLRSFEIGAGR